MRERLLVLVFGCLMLASCGDRKVATGDGGPGPDGRTEDSRAPADQGAADLSRPDLRSVDAAPADARPADVVSIDGGPADAAPADAAPSPDGCFCQGDEVWIRSACVATDQIGCGPGCDPNVASSCPSGYECDQWAAAPCCMCAAAVPACVPKPTTGPLSGPLRISPVDGIAGQSVQIVIEGAPFYIGALFYIVRMGTEEVIESPTMKPCSTAGDFTPATPGVYAVEVSQYGGGDPWVLAGFYTASGGVIDPPTVQPGYPCAANPAPGDPACAQGGGYSCSCVAGRCVCNPP